MFIPLHDWGHLPQPTVMMLDQECQNSANAVLQAWTLQPPFCYKMESMGGLHHHIALFLIKEHEVARGNPDLCMDIWASVQFSLVAQLCPTLRPHEPRHARPPCPSPTPWVYPNSCPSSRWYHLAISSSVIPFSSWPQSLPASVFSDESTLRMRWPKYWSFSFSIIPSKEHPGLISFGMDWLDLLAVQGTLKSLLRHHSSKTLILWHSAFFTVQLSYPYMTTGKTIALTRRTFVGKVMSLLLNMLSRLWICYLFCIEDCKIKWKLRSRITFSI